MLLSVREFSMSELRTGQEVERIRTDQEECLPTQEMLSSKTRNRCGWEEAHEHQIAQAAGTAHRQRIHQRKNAMILLKSTNCRTRNQTKRKTPGRVGGGKQRPLHNATTLRHSTKEVNNKTAKSCQAPFCIPSIAAKECTTWPGC